MLTATGCASPPASRMAATVVASEPASGCWPSSRVRAAQITRPPSAELRHDQKDSDSLPPYAVLDPILEAFIEEDASVDEIVARGFERSTVIRVLEMVRKAEYKRRQAPPGIKVTTRAFGRDRRVPITNRYGG